MDGGLRRLTRLNSGRPLRGNEGGMPPEDVATAREYGLEVTKAPEPGPTVEVRELFHRLFGEPQACAEPSPYLATYERLRARIHPESAGGHDGEDVTGSIEFRYWPTLRLGYIENVHVSTGKRRRGLGVKLVGFAVQHLSRRGSGQIHAFTVSREGSSLFASAGFAAGPPEDEGQPWRRWVSIQAR